MGVTARRSARSLGAVSQRGFSSQSACGNSGNAPCGISSVIKTIYSFGVRVSARKRPLASGHAPRAGNGALGLAQARGITHYVTLGLTGSRTLGLAEARCTVRVQDPARDPVCGALGYVRGASLAASLRDDSRRRTWRSSTSFSLRRTSACSTPSQRGGGHARARAGTKPLCFAAWYNGALQCRGRRQPARCTASPIPLPQRLLFSRPLRPPRDILSPRPRI